jgi:hypothetical protein
LLPVIRATRAPLDDLTRNSRMLMSTDTSPAVGADHDIDRQGKAGGKILEEDLCGVVARVGRAAAAHDDHARRILILIGHQCNTLVLGAGGYRFNDYPRLGLPLSVLVVVAGVPLIAFFWRCH